MFARIRDHPHGWSLLGREGTASPPTGAKEPTARNAPRSTGPRHAVAPTVEPGAGAARVDADEIRPVLARILKDVDERVAYISRRLQRSSVVAVREDSAASIPQAIQPLRDANEQTLHTPRERARVLGLDDQVQLVRLDRKLDEPKPESVGSSAQFLAQARDGAFTARVGQAATSRVVTSTGSWRVSGDLVV